MKASDMVARFHGGQLDDQRFSDWPDPPMSPVWVEHSAEAAIMTEEPDSEHQGAGFDRYSLAEVVADLAVYQLVEPSGAKTADVIRRRP